MSWHQSSFVSETLPRENYDECSTKMAASLKISKKTVKKNSHCVNGRKQKIAEVLIAVSVYFQLKIIIIMIIIKIIIIIIIMMIRIWEIEKPVNPDSPVFKFKQTPISELRASMENIGTTPLELGLLSHSCYMNIYTYDTPSKRMFFTEKPPPPPFECLTLNNGTPFICLLKSDCL